MEIKYIIERVKNVNPGILLGITLISIFSGCDTEGDLAEEGTYVSVNSHDFTIIGDAESELGFYINGDSLVNGTEYYPEGTVLNIELRKRETGEVLVDSTRTTVFGEDIIITAFYTGDIIIPMKPLTEKEREPAPEGYKKVRFINFIKDEGFLGGKTLKLEVYGVYPYEGGSRPEDETMTDNPIYVIENIPPDDFSPFINIPELETVSRETGLDIQQTVAKIYDAETGELLSDAYVEEGEIFPGFPSFGIKRNVRGEKQIGNLISAGNNNAATLQFQSSFYEEVGYVYSQLIIEALSE